MRVLTPSCDSCHISVPGQVGILATVGAVQQLAVYRRPHVAVLSTGVTAVLSTGLTRTRQLTARTKKRCPLARKQVDLRPRCEQKVEASWDEAQADGDVDTAADWMRLSLFAKMCVLPGMEEHFSSR